MRLTEIARQLVRWATALGRAARREKASRTPYPDMLDCAWLGADADGRLAAFVTAGFAPIPEAALERRDEILEIEGWLLALPTLGEPTIVLRHGDTSSYAALAARGVFVYDWTDESWQHSSYELIAAPHSALTLDQLPPQLACAAVPLPAGLSVGSAELKIRGLTPPER